uniref:HEAT repeat-containing protein 1-like n=1 Tax=Myxine glutinosa TaxID=7769 RepID=UPI00358E6AD1
MQLRTTLAHELPPRVLIPAVSQAYGSLLESAHELSLVSLMSLLQEHISCLSAEDLNAHLSTLSSFFTKALNYRSTHKQDPLERVGEIEGRVIDSLVALVMKLSEMTFRPIFFKLFDWAAGEGAPRHRLITFWRLAACLANRLRGLFSLFAGHLVQPAASMLAWLCHTDTDENNPLSESESCLLLDSLLSCLLSIFLHDTQHFITKERSDTLTVPLIDQLANMLGGEAIYHTRVTDLLVPCIVQFAISLADNSAMKPLHQQILFKMHHTASQVRFAALIQLLELASRLREDYMPLLPEAVPYLAELMEDDSEEVEQQCQKVVRQLEIILGEPLQSYF